MRATRWLGVVVAAAVLAGGVAACGSDGDSRGPGASATADTSDLASMPVAREMTVEMRDLAFEPARMTMRANEVVEITFHNNGAILHDYTIDEMPADVVEMMGGSGMAIEAHMGNEAHRPMAAMHMALDTGQQGLMRLRVHEPGEYAYYCTVPGHREAGMTGMLTIE